MTAAPLLPGPDEQPDPPHQWPALPEPAQQPGSPRWGTAPLEPAWLTELGFTDPAIFPDELCTDADIPPSDEDYLVPDPADVTSCPPELEGLTGEELDALPATITTARRALPPWPLSYRDPGGGGELAALLPRDATGPGCGFADGGALDTLPAGPPLAAFTNDAHTDLHTLPDDQLIGVLRAARRLTSWAQAHELTTILALAARRPADGHPPTPPGQLPSHLSEFVDAELAAALTLTTRAATTHLALALDLAPRHATLASLAAGWIDLPRATLIATMTSLLTDQHATQVEATVLPGAPDQNTAQLRRALHRAILQVDPAAAQRRREQAQQTARVETWADPEGTTTLAGRNLPPTQTLAASQRLTHIATTWKHAGAHGGMDLLRAHAYLALLNSQPIDTPPASLLTATSQPAVPNPPAAPDADPATPDPAVTEASGADPAEQQADGGPQLPSGLCRPSGPELPPMAGLINLTVPLTTLLQLSDHPGEVRGLGPLDADATRQLACALAGHRATRWQITVTSPAGYALANGTARGSPTHRTGKPADSRRWTVKVTAEPIAAGSCDHRQREPGYHPSPSLQALVRARSSTCTYYGCGRQAVRCDLDHTIPHDHGGPTCECNLAPLCRYHHRVKQAQGWKLQHLTPGVMAWLTPAGRRYITLPTEYRC